jgi:ribonuclease VapC
MAVEAEVVIDASSVLAFLLRESGWEKAQAFLPMGVMSVVNFAEVVQRLRRNGGDAATCLAILAAEGLTFVDADILLSNSAAELERTTRRYGVSLADRFCLALAMQRRCPVLTADTIWKELGLPVEIEQLR